MPGQFWMLVKFLGPSSFICIQICTHSARGVHTSTYASSVCDVMRLYSVINHTGTSYIISTAYKTAIHQPGRCALRGKAMDFSNEFIVLPKNHIKIIGLKIMTRPAKAM